MDKLSMDKLSHFFAGMLTATLVIAVIMVVKTTIQYAADASIEDGKVEHLTIKYKNSKQEIADKEMLVSIMKQHFPSSNWSHVDTKAGERCIELDAWSTDKK